jgi:hypothetical protein
MTFGEIKNLPLLSDEWLIVIDKKMDVMLKF